MVPGQRLLLVAAEPREFEGLLRFCSGLRRLQWPVDWARYGESNGRQFWMAANGAGAAHAQEAADIGYEAARPDAIVTMGFCGGLDPALRIGDVFVATSIESATRRFHVCVPESKSAHTRGVLVSGDRVAQTAAEKASLRQTGAAAVEMEAGGVAQSAEQHGASLFCVRAVTDTAADNFAIDFNRVLREDGHFDTIEILKSALRNPGQAFPELFRLRRHCRIATSTLGEFIAGCRF